VVRHRLGDVVIVIGIDPSLTATGVCWPNGLTEVIKWRDRGVERLDHIYDWASIDVERTLANAHGGIHWRREVLVVIEGYSMGSARQQSHAHGLGELGGVLRLALAHCCVDFIDVPPACVKKYATGKGNANKDLVRDNARDRLGLPMGVTSDEADAAWLRQIGLALMEPGEAVPVPKSHLAALDKLTPDGIVLGGAA
jgi:crossover junction endodeoxyribonuclease RuvC